MHRSTQRSPRQSLNLTPMTSLPKMTRVLMLWQVMLIHRQRWPCMTTNPLACPQVQSMWEAADLTMVKRGKAKRVVDARKGRTGMMECSILMTKQLDKACIMMTWVTDKKGQSGVQLNYKTRYALFTNI